LNFLKKEAAKSFESFTCKKIIILNQLFSQFVFAMLNEK